jgi:hypothetical protein
MADFCNRSRTDILQSAKKKPIGCRGPGYNKKMLKLKIYTNACGVVLLQNKKYQPMHTTTAI